MQGEREPSLRTLFGNLLILAGVRILPKILARPANFDFFTDEEVAIELLERVWTELDLGSREAFLVESAVDRLIRTRAGPLAVLLQSEAHKCRPSQ
jgi:hypothetical protein